MTWCDRIGRRDVAFPDGGGAYGVARAYLGRRAALVAALTSAFPSLLPHTMWLCLSVLAVVTAIDLRGIAHSARAFIVPTAIYAGSIVIVILFGPYRSEPAVRSPP